MLNKTILLTLTIAALFSAALAACPSACSGHGSCGNHDKCSCYMNWEGSDCSAKTCPQGNGMTCSGRGTCDGGAGECACAEGYSGDACQRTLCPNECSGKGSCDTSTGLCSCAGGFSGNDCSSRLCPRGDDPLTHEVENQGDGTVMQQSEVQQVTFSAGMGLAGSATLTYTDLYGQSWTTRPIALGEAHHYVLEYALGTHTADKCWLVLSYGGVVGKTSQNTLGGLNAEVIRATVLGLSPIYDLSATANPNLARSVRVVERPGLTSHKFQDGIKAASKKTFDIYITADPFSGLKEAGGLKEFTAYLANGTAALTAGTTNAAGTAEIDEIGAGNAYVAVTSGADASAAIKDALEGLPNNVIPAVTVTKSDYTTGNTDDGGNYGNSFHQSYRITFSSSSNTGDQNMLSCDASACNHDGCVNRKVGASSVTYLHSDIAAGTPTTKTRKSPKVNFNGQGYFVVDVHRNTGTAPLNGDFSSGEAYVEWNTGSGVERATFPLIATAATAQTALRGITGWSGVTVASLCGGSACSTDLLHTKAHAYTVTFPAGYDDGGQTPNVGIVGTYGGAAALADSGNGDGKVIIVDQRFSNTLFLGDITGWQKVTCTKGTTDADLDVCTATPSVQFQIGDNFKLTYVRFGYEDANTLANTVAGDFSTLHHATADFGFHSSFSANADAFIRINYDAAYPTVASIITDDYFAVGSTVEVLDTTWDLDASGMPDATQSTNAYRNFQVLSHVKNIHGHSFAKLDSSPTSDSASNYALKVTTNNHTVTARTDIEINAVQNEVQSIRGFVSNEMKYSTTAGADAFRLYINKDKPNVEFTEVLDGASTVLELQEAINAFSVLSGPVTVAQTAAGLGEIKITFAAIDGDVPQVEAVTEASHSGGSATNGLSWVSLTQHEGWSFFAGKNARLENVEPGSIINITSRETVTFEIGSFAAGSLVLSYDGNVGGTAIAKDSVDVAGLVAALNSIKDHKGIAKFAFDAAANPADITGADNGGFTVKMPEGVDGSKLGLSPASGSEVATISKSVAKNNNGKSFKVVRVENNYQALSPTSTQTTATFADTHNVVTAYGVAVGDEIRYTQAAAGTHCQLVDATGAAPDTPYEDVYITIVGYDTTDTSEETVLTHGGTTAATDTDCAASITRTTIVVDAMPDAMAAASTGKDVEMEIKGPAGSCSVTEAVKGTYESDVCSSRGSCDGASGLCTCHEGYSGEACETQTVLV